MLSMLSSQSKRILVKMRTLLASVIVFMILNMHVGNTARILGIFPKTSYSHQIVYRELMLALNKRGHELVVVTPDPINDSTLMNYTEIDVSVSDNMGSSVNFYDVRKSIGWMRFMQEVVLLQSLWEVEVIFENPDFQRMISLQRNETFDLLIVEIPTFHALYGLAVRFNVPIIGIFSMGLIDPFNYAIGNPITSSHPSNWVLGVSTGNHISFWERLMNYVALLNLRRFYKKLILGQHEIANKYLGADIPHVGEIEKNMSLVLVNHQAALSFVRPNVPTVIEFGGFHLSKGAQTLPQDLKEFLDGATEGFIYMSLGTSVKCSTLPNFILEHFIAVFSELPYRILWKFEDDVMPGKPDNVYIAKWLPQQSVLAHHNIKAFIYQGGVQSTEEAVHYAVPLLGIPFIADQDTQVRKMVSLGVARSLEIIDLNRSDLEEALHDVIYNKSYKEKMLELRSIVNDRPYDHLENAVWWTEFVIRHKGAPHLRYSSIDDPWYQEYDVDIVAFISISTFTTASLILIIAYRITIHTTRLLRSPEIIRK